MRAGVWWGGYFLVSFVGPYKKARGAPGHGAPGRGLPRPGPLADVVEQLGLFLTVVDEAAEGASLLCEGYGVAVVSGRLDPGRRRWTAAHELGHHLLQDPYHSDAGVAASRSEQEDRIDCFAGEFLLPSPDVTNAWSRTAENQSPRAVLLGLAASYRLSWSAVVNRARELGLLNGTEARRQKADTPQLGDFLAAHGNAPVPDLEIGTTGTMWRQAALAAWEQGAINGARTVELLYGAITEEQLPSRNLEEPLP